MGEKIGCADDVARQQVGRELDALELDAERGAERLDQEGFGEAGHASSRRTVAGGQGRDEQALDDGIPSR